METTQNDDMLEIDLQDLLFALVQKIWLLIITTVLGTVAAALVTILAITPQYTSSSTIFVMNPSTDLSSLSLTDLQAGAALTNDYMLLVKTRPVLNEVIDNLSLDMSYGELTGQISTANPTNTRFLTITVQNADPYMAKTIVDEVTKVSIKRIAEVMDTAEPNVVEEGVVNTAPVSPSLKKNIVLGGVLGFALAAGIVLLGFLLNDTIKTSEDVEKYLGINTLAVIPVEEKQTKAKMQRRDRKEDRIARIHLKKGK